MSHPSYPVITTVVEDQLWSILDDPLTDKMQGRINTVVEGLAETPEAFEKDEATKMATTILLSLYAIEGSTGVALIAMFLWDPEAEEKPMFRLCKAAVVGDLPPHDPEEEAESVAMEVLRDVGKHLSREVRLSLAGNLGAHISPLDPSQARAEDLDLSMN